MMLKHVFSCCIVSILLGFSILQYLTCHPLQMSLYLFLSCVLLFLLLVFFYIHHQKRVGFRLTLLLSIVLLLSGYFLAFCFFMNPEETKTLPVITRAKDDKGLGHKAVIVLAHGEPETYDPSAWIKQMKELDAQHVPFIPYAVRPFFFYKLREEYLIAGKSGHNFECLQIMKEMEQEFRKQGDTSTKFYMSYLENEPYPDTAFIQALNEGASDIVVCNVFVTVSNHTEEGIKLISQLKPEEYGVRVQYTKPLYDSEILQQLYVKKTEESSIGYQKAKVGVLLVGHGQPVEWDKEFYTETLQETSFRTDILKQLSHQGYPMQNLSMAWMEFREPRPKDAVKQLLAKGVTQIFYFSTIIGSESLHAKLNVPELMNQINIPSEVSLQQLTAFEDKTGIVHALIERIQALQ